MQVSHSLSYMCACIHSSSMKNKINIPETKLYGILTIIRNIRVPFL